MIRYLFLALLLACTPACAVSIWNSTAVDPVLETYRIPVDVSSSGSPSHITPLTLKAYVFETPISAQVPDDDIPGGNARGANAVDWQTSRYDATMVASGDQSTIGGGQNNIASGNNSTIGGGAGNTASGNDSVVAGGSAGTASGTASFIGSGSGVIASGTRAVVVGGYNNVADGYESWITGGVNANTRGVRGSFAYGGYFGQTFGVMIGASTTGDTPTVLSSYEASYGAAYNAAIPSATVAACVGIFVSTSASATAGFECKGVVKNIGGTTTLVTGACASIGTPDAALSTVTMSMQANNTDDTLEFVFTGVTETAITTGGEVKCSTSYTP